MSGGEPARKIHYEWAQEGKQPGSYDDYEILSCSQLLSARDFATNATRYATGTHADLPQVTIASAQLTKGTDGQVHDHLVLALQEWSDQRDGTGRKIACTRWFYVPYAQVVEHPVSYEGLYHAFGDVVLPPALAIPPFTVDVPAFRPDTVTAGETEKWAAALLLTGRPVCVVGAEGTPLHERLRFLDTVAALLPYGMRARLTASTWTSSTSNHKIKLSFARHAPDGAHEVIWHHGASIPDREREAHRYFDLLSQRPVAYLAGRLAEHTAPLSFGQEDRDRALAVLEECARHQMPVGDVLDPDLNPDLDPPPTRDEPTRAYLRPVGDDRASRPDEMPSITERTSPRPMTMAQLILVLRDARSRSEVDEIVHEMQDRAGTNPSDRDALRRCLAESDLIPKKLGGFEDRDWEETRLEQVTQAAFPDEDLRSPDVLERSACLAAQPETPPMVVITLTQLAMRTPGNLPLHWTTIRDQNLRKHHLRREWTRLGAFAAATVCVVVLGVMVVNMLVGDDAPVTSKPAVTQTTPGLPTTIRLFRQGQPPSVHLSERITLALGDDGWDPQDDTGSLAKALDSPEPHLVIAYDLDVLASQGPVSPGMESEALSHELERLLANRGFTIIPVLASVAEDRLLVKKSAGIEDIPAARNSQLKIAALEGYDEGLVKSFSNILNRKEIATSTADGNWDALIVPSKVDSGLNVDDYINIDLPLPEKTLTVLTNADQAQKSRIVEAVIRATTQSAPVTESADIPSDAAAFPNDETSGMSRTLKSILWASVAVMFFIVVVAVYVHYFNRPSRR